MPTSIHRVIVDLGPNRPLVDGDSIRLTQIVTTLLSDAIKYSPHGGDPLVNPRPVDGMVNVSVKDQGGGIPPEVVGRIFGRSQRYDEGGNNQRVVRVRRGPTNVSSARRRCAEGDRGPGAPHNLGAFVGLATLRADRCRRSNAEVGGSSPRPHQCFEFNQPRRSGPCPAAANICFEPHVVMRDA